METLGKGKNRVVGKIKEIPRKSIKHVEEGKKWRKEAGESELAFLKPAVM